MSGIAFPIKNRRAQHPAFPVIEISRLTLADAADWQAAIMTECRRQRDLTPSLVGFLEARGLLSRCAFLLSDGPDEPLCLHHPEAPGSSPFESSRERSILARPDETDHHLEFAQNVGATYAESIAAGEPIFNRVIVSGVGRPFVYTHALYGWVDERGRRSVLSAIDIQTLH